MARVRPRTCHFGKPSGTVSGLTATSTSVRAKPIQGVTSGRQLDVTEKLLRVKPCTPLSATISGPNCT